MQNVLIVHAHPEPQSFSSALAQQARHVFERRGCVVQVSDLYAMNFDPVARAGDFVARANPDYLVYALEQRLAHTGGTLRSDIAAEVEKVLWADLLVLNFPIYWFSVPAIMKGWIDRVFLSGAFYGGKRFYDRGGMAGKRALVCATLGGQPHMFGDAAIHGELDLMLRPLLRGTLGYVGFDVLAPFYGFHVPYISPEARTTMLAEFNAALAMIDGRVCLAMPAMANFDANLRPRAEPE